ncbi:ran-binding protein M homolog [Macadamia integrifolia]|uniref:ran-binding protein M homolog n=1 Tax=Macadamia integrifolia TaxID=60698 RepID=UPI001C4F0031|nr:ran-binding protein M homolog [Macadamia integrifolia]
MLDHHITLYWTGGPFFSGHQNKSLLHPCSVPVDSKILVEGSYLEGDSDPRAPAPKPSSVLRSKPGFRSALGVVAIISFSWEANSYGYHGDDGLLYRGQGKGETFGPTFTSGDTVGGGINYASQEFFFTKNGKLVGTVYKDVKGPLFPTISVHSQNEEVNVNFGQQPFVFDVEAFVQEERMKQQMIIEKISLPPNISHCIIRSYFLHYGYQDTLNSFDFASRSTLPPIPVVQENGINEQGDTYALRHRKILRQLIRSGELDSVFGKLRDWYPQIVQNESSTICFLLHCQKFIELVRVSDLEDAVIYARAELARFFGITTVAGLLQDCIALLAYEEPMKSPVGYLLDVSQREVVADAVNAMVLSTNPNMKDSPSYLQSYLERLLRQLAACCLERRSLHGDQGETFHLQRVLQSGNEGKR